MTPDIERAARTIFVKITEGSNFTGLNGGGTYDNDTSDEAKVIWHSIAAAALETLAESEVFVEAATEAFLKSWVYRNGGMLAGGEEVHHADMRAALRAGLDAVLGRARP